MTWKELKDFCNSLPESELEKDGKKWNSLTFQIENARYKPSDGDIIFIPENDNSSVEKYANRIVIYKEGNRFYALYNLSRQTIYTNEESAIKDWDKPRPATISILR